MPLYKGKGNREECHNYRGIRLLSVPGKICGRILHERMVKMTEKNVGDEQGGFRKGRGCVDQIFAVEIMVEKYLEKERKLFAAFMDLEKAVMNKSIGGGAKVTTMGTKIHEERPHTQERLKRGDIMAAIRKLKLGKAPDRMV